MKLVIVKLVKLVMCQLVVGKSLPNGDSEQHSADQRRSRRTAKKDEQVETKEMRRRSQAGLLGLLRFAISALLVALDISPMMLLSAVCGSGSKERSGGEQSIERKQ